MSRQERIDTIFHNFHVIKRAFSHRGQFSHLRFGVTMTQAPILVLLAHEGRKTMGEITKDLGVSKGAATQLLDGLIEKGLVKRTQDETDKRVFHVSISSKGRAHFCQARNHGDKHITQLFDLLDDAELEQIETITTKLAERAKETRQ